MDRRMGIGGVLDIRGEGSSPLGGPRPIFLGLALAVLAVFGRLAFFDFVFFDDHVYVIEKQEVLSGLTAGSLWWALRATDAGFWHPLTWVSLMIDHEIWGLHPGGYHLTNVLLHLGATLLLFAGLNRLTGAMGKSAFVAALFALHPLHVESVAWIAERKDVLSGLFWMLCLLLYARYAEKPNWRRYSLILLSFVLGLMAKSMVVTLPVILLLLDVWPLGRWSRRDWPRLVMEKVPFLLLGFAVGLVTIAAEQQVGALKSLDEFSPGSRLANAVVAYGFYLYKTLLPLCLSVHYPHPGSWSFPVVVLSLGVWMVLSFLAIQCRTVRPYVFMGWFWYVFTLLPVIGLIQIGSHAFADRYTYIPLIGIFVAVVWYAGDWAERKEGLLKPVVVAGMVGLSLFTILSSLQVGHWQNAETLFRQAVAVTRDNALAHNNLGAALSRQGRHGEALVPLAQSLRIRPDYVEALFNTGVALAGQGRYAESLEFYGRVLKLQPRFAQAHNNMAILYARMGNLDQAQIHFREAIRLQPGYRDAIRNLRIAEEERVRIQKDSKILKLKSYHSPR